MIHLGVCDAGRGIFYRSAGSIRNSIRLMKSDQQLAPPDKIGSVVGRERILVLTRRLRPSPISSRVSQNAAALLFDLSIVDIR
jgi:predicted anti-sigma-YlaC factor YlaD